MKKQWFLIPLIFIAITIAALWGGDKYLYSLAYDQFQDIASEATGCKGDECQQSIADVINLLQEKRELSQRQVMRCLGANIIEERDFSFLNSIKNQFVELVYKTCESDKVILEDANIELYTGLGSHDE